MKREAPIDRRRRAISIAALVGVAAPCDVRAAGVPIVLGTSTPGGGFSRYGDALAFAVNTRAGGPLVEARPTNGTAENLERLAAGTLDAALVQGTAASALFARAPTGRLRILWAMYPSPGLLAVPTASPARRLEDLRGQPIVFGVRTSGLVTLARQVFDGLGLDIDRDFEALYVDAAAEAPPLVASGRARGLWGAGEGWPGFEALARSPGGARFLAPAPSQMAAILAKHPSLAPMDVPAGAYPGIDRPLPTIGSINWILVRADLDDDIVTAFVDAMRTASPDLARALPQAAFSTWDNTIARAPSRAWLHPAVAARAMRDAT